MMVMRKTSARQLKLLLQVASAALLLLATQVHAQDTSKMGGALRAAMAGSPPTLDFICSFAAQTRDYGVYIFESLVTIDEHYNVAPQLASHWDVSKDGLTYTFYLRTGIKFHNGEVMTANDVLTSFKRFLSQSPRASDLSMIGSMRVVSSLTFQVTLKTPSAAFLPLLAYPGPAVAIMPKDLITSKDGKVIPCGKLPLTSIVGTGPYKLVEWIPDKYVHLQRFDDYSPSLQEPSGYAGKRIAYIKDLYFVPVPEASSRVAGLETGEYDYAQTLPPQSFKKLNSETQITTEVIKPSYWIAMHLNTENGILKDKRLREAIQVGLNEQEIMQVAAGVPELMRLDSSLYFPEQYWHSNVCDDRYNQYDVQKAKALMRESGYHGQTIKILTAKDFQWMYLAALAVQSQLQALGFRVQLQAYDYSTMIDVFQHKRDKWDISFNGFSIRTDPGAFKFVFYSTSGYQPYTNHDLDALWDKGAVTLDKTQRYQIYQKIQDIICTDIPVINLGDVFNYDSIRNVIHGFQTFYTTPRFWNVWIDH